MARVSGGVRVTFVGHDASRTGAPIVLATLLRWLADHERAEARLLLDRGGPLLEQYRRILPTAVLATGRPALVQAARGVRSLRRPSRTPGDPLAPLRALELRRHPAGDLVVANTLAALPTASALARRATPAARLVCHVHELDGVATRLLPQDGPARQRLLDGVHRFVAAGADVARMLVERLGVDPGRVATVAPCIDVSMPSAGSVDRLRRELTGGTDRPVVLAVGAMVRRKGPERFVDLMAGLADHPSEPVGVWLGGDPRSPVWAETRADLHRAGLADTVRLLPTVDRPLEHLAAADLLVSTAVEDPYPLSVLEAAALGRAVAGFDSGGLAEVLRRAGQGEQVRPVGDLLGLHDVVVAALDDPRRRVRRGRELVAQVAPEHSVARVGPRWWAEVCT